MKTISGVPAYPTDGKSVIQAVFATIDPNRGDDVLLPQGRYKAGGLTSTIQGLNFCGEGMPGLDNATCRGTTQIVVPDGPDGLTLGILASHQTRGYGVRKLHLIAEGVGANKGLVILNAENDILEDMSVSDFAAGVGIEINGNTFASGGNAQYVEMRGVRIANCLVGLHLLGPANGVCILGGYFAGWPPAALSVRKGTGLLLEGGDSLYLRGTRFQSWQTCINLRKNVEHSIDARFENFGEAVRIGGACNGVEVYGGFSNGQTAVYVEAGARNVKIKPRYVAPDVQVPFVIEEPHPTITIEYAGF